MTGDAAQAEELAHWQRIQASDAPADFDAFLARYPSGACANLARRRLRRLAGGDDSKPGAAAVALPPAVAKARRKARAADAAAAPAPAPKRGWMIALGAVVVVGVIAAFMLRRGVPDEVAVPAMPAASAASAAVAVAPPVGRVCGEPVASAPADVAPVAVSASPVLAAAPLGAAAPSAPASAVLPPKALTPREAAAARKVADAAARARTKAGGPMPAATEPVARPADDERQRAPAAPPVAEAPKPVEAPASAAPAAPSEPCARRVFVARLSCLKDACVKPEWSKHPQCVEFRRLEESRQRGEQQN